MRRWKQQWFGALVAALAVTSGCSGDDDAGDTVVTTEAPPGTTDAPTTTTTTSSTTTSTTVPPSTTQSMEDLKAQIAADYQRSWQLRRELTENPTLDGLDEKLAQISAPGSEDYNTLRDFVTELVSLGERIVPGTPDEYRVDVERVDLSGTPPYAEATVTVCFVSNRVRVDASGAPVSDFGIVASRSQDDVVPTPNGWLPRGGFEDLWQGLGVTECPAA